MTYVEVWSEKYNKYDINIVTEGKYNVDIDNIASTKDRSIASYIAKEIARRKNLTIQFRINNH